MTYAIRCHGGESFFDVTVFHVYMVKDGCRSLANVTLKVKADKLDQMPNISSNISVAWSGIVAMTMSR